MRGIVLAIMTSAVFVSVMLNERNMSDDADRGAAVLLAGMLFLTVACIVFGV